jgi:hypothetical protein
MDLENPPLDHRPPPEPRYPHVYVTFGAGVLQKEIDMHTADNPVEAKESPNGTVEADSIPCANVRTFLCSCACRSACSCHPGPRILQDRLS